MSEEQQTDISRRRFLGGAAAAFASLSVAPGVFLIRTANARPADEAAFLGFGISRASSAG